MPVQAGLDFNKKISRSLPASPVALGARPAGVPPVTECQLFNDSLFSSGAASIECTNVTFTAPDDSTRFCDEVVFDWHASSQSLKLASPCFVRVP